DQLMNGRVAQAHVQLSFGVSLPERATVDRSWPPFPRPGRRSAWRTRAIRACVSAIRACVSSARCLVARSLLRDLGCESFGKTQDKNNDSYSPPSNVLVVTNGV